MGWGIAFGILVVIMLVCSWFDSQLDSNNPIIHPVWLLVFLAFGVCWWFEAPIHRFLDPDHVRAMVEANRPK